MRKLFSLFLSLVATTSLWAHDFEVDGIYYNHLDGNNVEVTYRGYDYYSYDEYSGEVIIPSTVTYNGTTYSVTSIGRSAFHNCSSLTSITIPNSVTSIGNQAFCWCNSLTSITIPNSITSIGVQAFSDCSSLTSIIVEDANSTYDSRENCNAIIETATNTLIVGCQNTIIPNSVTSIGSNAFDGCTGLTSITIPESVTSIGRMAFYGCSSLPVENNLRYADTYLVEAVDKTLSTYSIKEGTKWIGSSAFSDCSSLKSITIPNSVTSIGNQAFYWCNSLTSVTIPNSVTEIGDGAFDCCESLTSPVYNAHCFAYMPRSYKGAYIIPEGIKQIAGNAFAYCSGLTSITIPNSITSIGERAFQKCSGLTSVSIGNSVTSIGRYAFYECSGLTSINIPNSVTSIGDYAFEYCSSLTSITIPNSVKEIGKGAFEWCSGLTSVTIGNSVTSIGDNAFDCCKGLTSVTLGSSVTSIGSWAFAYCSGLTSITIPNSVTSIGVGAFSDCKGLTSITIPNSVTSIGRYASRNCSGLTSVTIGNSVTSIGEGAFSNCPGLTFIESLAEVPPTLETDAFYNVPKNIPVYVRCGTVSAYQSAEGWKDFTNIQGAVEYSIAVGVNDSIMGTSQVDYITCEGAQITATANYGYHFVQWSDGNTDNPRSLGLTQDTVLTAEFAPNKYTITTVSSDTQRGTTKGDTTVNYLEYITISATASYGYHFVQWNDGNSVNPRQVQVTKDMTYTATFDKNTYAISLSCNEEQGRVEGVTSAEYLDTVTISVTPNIGYHFVQWSDGNTDNPRHFILTQDTTFSAEFAQSFSGQCGDNLYWSYNETAKTISITGSGEMYDYTATTQPWLLFKEQIVEVTTNNTVTSIGTSAFEGCVRLAKISLGTGLEKIATNAFAGCTRLYDIYVYATYPPLADESSFANYNVYVYIPCEYQRYYILDVVWGKFKFIECLESEETTTDGNVTVVPSTNDVTIIWPAEDNADTYTIVIKKGNEVFCTLTFNAEGQLLNIAFAPGRDGNHPAQYAEQAGKGYRFTVTSLESGTKYGYNIEVKDASNKTIKSHSGEFTTQSTTAVDNITTNNANIQKIIRDGQFIIIRDGVEYNAIGQEM